MKHNGAKLFIPTIAIKMLEDTEINPSLTPLLTSTYWGAKIFNNLPNNIRETKDRIIFKKLVKNWIWDEVPSY